MSLPDCCAVLSLPDILLFHMKEDLSLLPPDESPSMSETFLPSELTVVRVARVLDAGEDKGHGFGTTIFGQSVFIPASIMTRFGLVPGSKVVGQLGPNLRGKAAWRLVMCYPDRFDPTGWTRPVVSPFAQGVTEEQLERAVFGDGSRRDSGIDGSFTPTDLFEIVMGRPPELDAGVSQNHWDIVLHSQMILWLLSQARSGRLWETRVIPPGFPEVTMFWFSRVEDDALPYGAFEPDPE
jgi:hypothetical protein